MSGYRGSPDRLLAARVLAVLTLAVAVPSAQWWWHPSRPVVLVVAAVAGLVSAPLVTPVVDRWCARVAIVVNAPRWWIAPTNAALWAGGAVVAGPQPYVAAWLTLSTFAVWASWIDLHTHRIPNASSRTSALLVSILLSGAAYITGEPGALVRALTAALVTFGGLFTLATITRGQVGMGDAWFCVPLTLVCGYVAWERVGAALFAALLLMFPVAWLRVTIGRAGGYLAAGPYLLAGTVVALADSPTLSTAVVAVTVLSMLAGVTVLITRLGVGAAARVTRRRLPRAVAPPSPRHRPGGPDSPWPSRR
ncbi:prepilin peptidase [Nocardia sp. NPDC006044]|uniref:prepilin peptidase n=1 Tax=Nocardia sp. NPDC006044 TaxID=3364306 RepID=UPI00368F6B25